MIDVRVAGPAALLVAKAYKLGERFRETGQRRLVSKDAADVLRLMLTNEAGPVRRRFEALLVNSRAGTTTRRGLTYLDELFGASERPGVTMAVEALRTEVDADQIEVTAPAYTAALLRVVR